MPQGLDLNPTWVNHFQVFGAAGLETGEYRYYDAQMRGLNFEAMLTSLADAEPGDILLLHGCCHNPTGIDPTATQWEIQPSSAPNANCCLSLTLPIKGLLVVWMSAAGLRIFARYNREMLVASSFSKNFGLYNERVGAITPGD